MSRGVISRRSANFLSNSLAVAETLKYETCLIMPSCTSLRVYINRLVNCHWGIDATLTMSIRSLAFSLSSTSDQLMTSMQGMKCRSSGGGRALMTSRRCAQSFRTRYFLKCQISRPTPSSMHHGTHLSISSSTLSSGVRSKTMRPGEP